MALRESILCFYPELKDSTLVLDDSTLLNLKCINNGTLIVYPTWSGAGIAKSIQIIKSFYAEAYTGTIIIIDIDCMTHDFQLSLFGKACHGWGECFTILNGKISTK
jgi:hypothetical protein